MRNQLFSLGALVATLSACAAAPVHPITAQQARAFSETVRTAEQALFASPNEAAEEALRNAKSDFYYAEHLPSDPARARDMAARAQAEAESAVALSRGLAAVSATESAAAGE